MSFGSYKTEDLGRHVFTSRSSEIYEWRGNTLLKLFFENINPHLIIQEEINTAEAHAHGITKVNCYSHVRVKNRLGLILEKIPGETLLRRIIDDKSFGSKATEIQVSLHLKMHQAQTARMLKFKDKAIKALDSEPLSFLSENEKAAAVKKINALPDGNSILHLDCHTDNILYDGKEATIIDWMTAARGDPAAEAAMMKYLYAEAEMIPGLPPDVAASIEEMRTNQYVKYMAAYQAATNINDEEIALWRLPVLTVRLGVWNIKSEVYQLREKILAELK